MNISNSALLLLVLLGAEGDTPVAPKFPLGRETTYVTEPLDQDGFIDYGAALNDKLGKGITPETNANVLIWKALGPRPEGGSGMPAEYFKRLGIEEPPPQGDYFTDFIGYATDELKRDTENTADFQTLLDEQQRAMERPWIASDHPSVAKWLSANEKPLAIVLEATHRSAYFNPLSPEPADSDFPGLMGAPLPTLVKCKELARAFSARAMLKTGKGKLAEAWQDLLACHRLGRLVARGPTSIEGLVGIKIEEMAATADLAYLESPQLTAKQIRACLKDLQALSPLPPMVDKIELAERFMFLDTVKTIRLHGMRFFGMIEKLDDCGEEQEARPANGPSEQWLKSLELLDWEPALRNGNRWYDRIVAAYRLPDRVARQQEFDRIEAELKTLTTESKQYMFEVLAEIAPLPKSRGKVIGDILICLMVPALPSLQRAVDLAEQNQRNLYVAFALAAYQREHQSYPARLDELVPGYLAELPNDLFSNRPLLYHVAENGYLLYSVGSNSQDDGGQKANGKDAVADDQSIRMPLPEWKSTR